MNVRAALKNATHDAHERVDAAFAQDLATRDGYGRFLTAQAAALIAVENALEQAGSAELVEEWAIHRRSALLVADLHALGLPVPTPLAAPAYPDEATLAGGLYVLEGSRMGSAVLRRSVPDSLPTAFLSAKQSTGRWPRFVASLDPLLYSTQRLDAAVEGASQTFACFEQAANRVRSA